VQKPIVIFITAFKKYALEGFELDVLDYLVKPVPFERFLKAANKAADFHQLKKGVIAQHSESSFDYLFVNVEYNLVKIMVNDITYIEGLKDYLKIHLASSDLPVITKLPMKTIADRLPVSRFVRVHKSFMVAVNKISFIRKNRVYVGEQVIPVSDFYRDALFQVISPQKPG
jgi:DNA-binding LytR/AlgR family response regulator